MDTKSTNMKKGFLRRLIRERMLWVLVISFGIYAGLKLTISDLVLEGLYPKRFHKVKLDWSQEADVVFAGDSRIGTDIAPFVMSDILLGQRVLNFSFSGAGYSEDYLQAIENVLDMDSSKPSIVLGINPNQFTSKAITTNSFNDYREKFSTFDGQFQMHVERIAYPFERTLPVLQTARKVLANGPEPPRYYRHYSEDGWTGYTMVPSDDQSLLNIKYFDTIYRDNPIDPTLIEQFIQYVRQWNNKGITVYAFRPPVVEELSTLELELSGMDLPGFISDFESAGGVWIDVPSGPYADKTNDGHHLNREPALAYSKEIAKRIANYQARQDRRSEPFTIPAVNSDAVKVDLAEKPMMEK